MLFYAYCKQLLNNEVPLFHFTSTEQMYGDHSILGNPQPNHRISIQTYPKYRRFLSLAATSFFALILFNTWARLPTTSPLDQESISNISLIHSDPIDGLDQVTQPEQLLDIDPWNSSFYLKGPPTKRFRGLGHCKL